MDYFCNFCSNNTLNFDTWHDWYVHKNSIKHKNNKKTFFKENNVINLTKIIKKYVSGKITGDEIISEIEKTTINFKNNENSNS